LKDLKKSKGENMTRFQGVSSAVGPFTLFKPYSISPTPTP